MQAHIVCLTAHPPWLIHTSIIKAMRCIIQIVDLEGMASTLQLIQHPLEPILRGVPDFHDASPRVRSISPLQALDTAT
jgi:hypothetical protein